ncbi:hypothetical protein [Blastopirellula marina]|uniref:Uncharacterized protein n=1 Tax=Blastopirellula marina TaxID=124 RepID=A0A2S8GPY0_9BACT|nr:hypothetical protein [Blastopirellula marina]PQO46472.1 hypothetical protein C5Y93_08325 [Blastopirellula marina]
MSVHLLQREAVSWDTHSEESDLLLGNLPLEAEQVLGYRRLSQHQQAVRQLSSLKETLTSLDIRPFTQASVDKYKQRCEWIVTPMWGRVANVGFAIGFLAVLVAVPALIVSALVSWAGISFYLAAAALLGAVVGVSSLILGAVRLRERKWVMHELGSYAEAVPEFALQTALDIKRINPEVEFYVCSLEERRVVVDPFLVMRVKENGFHRDYYLEVWNESAFSGTREA